nr:Methyl-CpG-binding domain-containing protein [Ipomoea batatas]
MVAGKSPEPLPAGWSEHVKVKNGRKVKYYTNAPNGKKFYSKKDVICYMKIKGNSRGQNRAIAQRETRHSERNINSQSSKTAASPDKSPEWLPPGWMVEEKTRMSGATHGQIYKCYIDPFGRRFYSKPEVSRHLKTMNCNGPIGVGEEKKSNIEEPSCNKVSQNEKAEPSCNKVSQNEKAEPSCNEVSRNEKATGGQSHTSRKLRSGMCKQPSDIGSSVVVQSNLVDGLPPGWIKEVKTRAYAHGGIRRDPQYIDPVSGYVFLSKKDALRYIETGDIEKCAIRPKKRDSGSGTNEESASHSAAGRKAEQSSTKRQIFAGRESSEPTNLTEPQVESIKKRLRSAGRDAINTQVVEVKTECKTANEGTGTKPGSEARPSDLNGEISVSAFGNDETVSTPQSGLLHNQKLPESEKDKHSGTASITKSRKSRKNKAGSKKEKHSGTASLTKSRKSRKNKSLGTRARFSKRLAGHTPEEVANLGLGERVFRAAIRNCSGTKAKTSSVQVPVDPAQEMHAVRDSVGTETNASLVPALSNPPQEVCSATNSIGTEANASLAPPALINPPREVDSGVTASLAPTALINPPREVDSGVTEADASSVPAPNNLSDQEMPKHIDEPTKATDTCIGEKSWWTVEKEAVPENPISEPVTEKQDAENQTLEDPQLRYPFGDCWSDPCLEFAFKTLTGAIPVEDCLAYEQVPQQQFNPSYAQSSDGYFDLPLFDSYNLFPNDFPPSNSGQLDKNTSQDLPPATPPFLSPGNNGLPSCSGVASQPHLEPRKDFPAKAKS